jgi:8-amino-7-oxononanoate synthase
MLDLESFSIQQLNNKENQKLLRVVKSYKSEGVFKVDELGNKLYDFTSNDYFAMGYNPSVLNSIGNVQSCFGSGSSRLISGSSPLYEELEFALSSYHNIASSVVFGSGYLAAISFYDSFFDKYDLIVTDKNIHACHIDGIKLSGARFKRFKHNDCNHLEAILRKYRKDSKKCLIVSETLFSMHGDFADVEKLAELSRLYDSYLMFDDAHGFMVNNDLGKISRENLIIMGTCSKALGSYGGYISASKNICDFLKSDARALIYTTALPEIVLRASLSSINELISRKDFYQDTLLRNIRYFEKLFGVINKGSPIKIIEFGSIEAMELKYNEIYESGILVSKIRPPTSETPRIRVSISANHTNSMIESLVSLLR